MIKAKKIDYSDLSMKTLKVELAVYGVNTEDFLEKAEFAQALEDVKRNEKKTKKKKKKKRSSSREPALSSCEVSQTYCKGEKMLYVSSDGKYTESARILEVHFTQGADPFYIIRLDESRREKQTDGAHLVALRPEKSDVGPPQTESKSDGKFLSLPLKKDDEAPTNKRRSEPKTRSLPQRASSFEALLFRSNPLRVSSFSFSLPSQKKGELPTLSGLKQRRSETLPQCDSSFDAFLSRRKDELSKRSTKSVDSKTRSLPRRASSFDKALPSRRKDDLSKTSIHSRKSVDSKTRSLPRRASSFDKVLPSRRKDDLSKTSIHSRKSVDSKTRSLPRRGSSFDGLVGRKGDQLTASMRSTDSSRSFFSFLNNKGDKPQRRIAVTIPSKPLPTDDSPKLRPAPLLLVGEHEIKSIRRSSIGSRRSSIASSISSMSSSCIRSRSTPSRPRNKRHSIRPDASAENWKTPCFAWEG